MSPSTTGIVPGFLSTPSGWRATKGGGWLGWVRFDFYPRPPGGGRLSLRVPSFKPSLFLSTPSGWRATGQKWRWDRGGVISIHALRVEGDRRSSTTFLRRPYFYPRPPGGGRQYSC